MDLTKSQLIQTVRELSKQEPPYDPLQDNSVPVYFKLNDDPAVGSQNKKPIVPEGMITPFTLRSIIRENVLIMQMWRDAYGLYRMELPDAMRYIARAYRGGSMYPDIIINTLLSVKSDDSDMFGLSTDRNVILNPIVEDLDIKETYWNRMHNPETATILKYSNSSKSLYLYVENPYERNPLSILASYIIGQRTRSFIPYSYVDPLTGLYHTASKPKGIKVSWTDLPLIVQYRLYLSVLACEGILDISIFEDFIKYVEDNYVIFDEVIQSFDPQPEDSVAVNINFPCVICKQIQPESEYSWCGHGICLKCQMKTGRAKCLWCKCHYVCDKLDRLSENFMSDEQISQMIAPVMEYYNNRKVSSDFINNRIRRP